MRMKRYRKACVPAMLVAGFALAALATAYAQPAPLPATEPPSTLFASKLGDADVQLLMQGFWELSLVSSGTIAFGAGSASAYNPVPILFTQRPDLYLLLEFRKTWWLESWVSQKVESSRFALGYTGPEEGWLKEAVLGNTGIQIPATPLLNFGSAEGSFGARMSAIDNDSGISFDAMLRWDGLRWHSVRFFGLSALTQTKLDAGQWLRCRYFVLPHSGVSSLQLSERTGTVSRILAADEYSVTLSTGTILLAKPVSGELWASYSSGGTPNELRLWAKDQYNQYEAKNLYALQAVSQASLSVVRSETEKPDPNFIAEALPGGLVLVRPFDVSDPRDSLYKEPFQADAPWIYTPIADPDAKAPYPQASGFSLLAASSQQLEAIRIGSDAIEGSVSVFRNGAQSFAFTHDAASGTVSLFPPPALGEDIRIQYAVLSSDRSDGALVGAALAVFPLGSWNLSLGTGGRWPLPGVSYAQDDIKPAWAALSFGASIDRESYAFAVDLLAQYRRASASNLYRAAGMEDEPSALSPFTPLAGDPAISSQSVSDVSLQAAFPKDMAALHGSASVNRLLSISVPGAGTHAVRRFVQELPLSMFARLEFFIRVNSGNADNLRLSLGSAFSCSVNLNALPQGIWVKVSAELAPGGRVFVTRPDGVEVAGAAGVSSYSAGTQARAISIELNNASNLLCDVDEILLRDAVDGLSARGLLSTHVDSERFGFTLDALGNVGMQSSLYAKSGGRAQFGPLAITANLSPRLDANGPELAYAYALRMAPSQFGFSEEYSASAQLPGYSHASSLSLSAGSVLIGLEARSVLEPTESDLVHAMRRSWQASAAWDSYLGAKLRYASEGPAVDDVPASRSWLAAWESYWPGSAASGSRVSSYSVDAFMKSISLSASHEHEPSALAQSRFEAALSKTFRAGSIEVTPFYRRSSTHSDTTSADSFSEDQEAMLDAWLFSWPFWYALPFVEFFHSADSAGIADVQGLARAWDYQASTGIGLKRPMGQGLADLILPYNLDIGFSRIRLLAGDSYTDYSKFTCSLRSAAVNLFGSGGAMPRFPTLAYDEYSSRLELSLSSLFAADPVLVSVSMKHRADLEFADGKLFHLENGAAFGLERIGASWSDSLDLGFSLPKERSLLGDIVRRLFTIQDEPTLPADADTETENTLSPWLQSIQNSKLLLSDAFGLVLSVQDSATADLGCSLSARFTSSCRVASSLSFSFRTEAGLQLRMAALGPQWSIRYLIAIEGRVVF